MHSVQRVGLTAELGPDREDCLVLRLEPFATLTDGRRYSCAPDAEVSELCLAHSEDPWSLEMIEDEVLGHARSALGSGLEEAFFGPLAAALAASGIAVQAADLAAEDLEVDLGPTVWSRFSPIAERRPRLRVPDSGAPREIDAATEQELEHLLTYARHCGQAADRQGREDIRTSTLAYIGGALTTMLHLGHIDERQHSEWHGRLIKALGEPPGGWKFVGW